MSAEAVIRNFAYGSNMLSRRLHERVPSAKSVGIGCLRGYELRWHKVSTDKSGKCDVVSVPTLDAVVYGVIYEIPAKEKSNLDHTDGLGFGYAEMTVEIETGSGTVSASLYYATKKEPSLLPYSWYKALVVAGAKEHRLPDAYVAALESVTSKEDSNEKRATRNFALASAG